MPTAYTLILHADQWRLAAAESADGAVTWLDLASSPAESTGSVGATDAAVPSTEAPSSQASGESDASSEATASTLPGESDLARRAKRVRQALKSHGHGGEPILLARSAPDCLTATVSTEGVDRANRRRTLAFQLEEHLPLAAEDVIADYLEHPDGRALAVATELADLRGTIDALEQAGVPVAHACPASMLAAAEILPADKRGSTEPALLIEGSAGWELIETRQARPVAWWWFGDDGASRDQRLADWADEQRRADLTPTLYHLAPSPNDSDASHASDPAPSADRPGLPADVHRIPVDTADVDEPVVRQAARVRDGSAAPWIEFRRDALAAPGRFATYRKPVAALVLAAIVLLVGVFTTGWYRAGQYRERAADHRAAVTDHFREALPDQRVPPVGVLQRMASEYRNLAGVGGQATDPRTAAELHPLPALTQLQVVLDVLPDDLRYRILDLTIQPDRVRIDGEAQQHAHAERLVLALRDSGWYTVDSPKTQSLRERGVGFVFTAQPRLDATGTDDAARAGVRNQPPTSAAAAATPEGGRP